MHICTIEKMVKSLFPGLMHMHALNDNLHWYADEIEMEKAYIFYKTHKN